MSEKRFLAVIFDLDGTLLDSLADLAEAMNSVLAGMGFPEHPREAYRYFVGEGIIALAERVLPENRRDEVTVRSCAEGMRSEYRRRWDHQTRPYPGILEMLDLLAELRVPMNVFSNKPAEFTRVAVEKLLPGRRFEHVLGVDDDLPRKPDPTGAARIAKSLGIPAGGIVFLGDTRTDMQTARSAGNYAVGALWGFRTEEELLAHGARMLIRNPAELLELFSDWEDSAEEETS